jgi:hypothetical protein
VKQSNLAFSMRLLRLRAGTFGRTYLLRKGKQFGVQARTFQVLATMP